MTAEHLDPPSSVPPASPPMGPAATDHHGMGSTVAIAAVVAFVIAAFAGLAGGFLGARLVLDDTRQTLSPSPARVNVTPSQSSDPVVTAAAKAVPSVVNVEARTNPHTGTGAKLPQNHPAVPSESNGSGVAFRRGKDGSTYLLTNAHVAGDAKAVVIRDSSGHSFDADVVGQDSDTDIAVLKAQASIPLIRTTDSSGLVVGQTVVAIGSPYGLDHSVTSGIISALGRSLPDLSQSSSAYPLIDVIQTDAAINPGNSGGALVDSAGRLIGINTAIFSESGSSDGVGFAVPADAAIRVANQIIDSGSVRHPFLGIYGETVTSSIAAQHKLSVKEGAFVYEVIDGTGAQRAGVRSGDVVTALNEAPIRSMNDLVLQTRRKSVGDVVTLTVVRKGATQRLKMTVGDRPTNVKTPSREATPTP